MTSTLVAKKILATKEVPLKWDHFERAKPILKVLPVL